MRGSLVESFLFILTCQQEFYCITTTIIINTRHHCYRYQHQTPLLSLPTPDTTAIVTNTRHHYYRYQHQAPLLSLPTPGTTTIVTNTRHHYYHYQHQAPLSHIITNITFSNANSLVYLVKCNQTLHVIISRKQRHKE